MRNPYWHVLFVYNVIKIQFKRPSVWVSQYNREVAMAELLSGLLTAVGGLLNTVRTVVTPLFARGQVVYGYSIVLAILIALLVLQFTGKNDVIYPDYGEGLLNLSKS